MRIANNLEELKELLNKLARFKDMSIKIDIVNAESLNRYFKQYLNNYWTKFTDDMTDDEILDLASQLLMEAGDA